MNSGSDGLSRRQFLGGASAVAGMAMLPGTAHGMRRIQGANDKIVLGLIGCGGQGAWNMRVLMGHPEIEVAALCDVDTRRIPNDYNDVTKKYDRKPEIFHDYRKMLERKDIDAVIIGTPDHWHALNFIHACEAGKDVFQEKPLSHNIVECLAMAKVHRQTKRVVQCGTWQRSNREFTDSIAYVRAGKLGNVTQCRAWISDSFQAGNVQPSTAPIEFDYDFWLGPAAATPYYANRVHWNWRWFINTASGLSGDWGVHMMDIALLGMSQSQDLVMPTEVSAYGGRWAYPKDDRTAPDTTEALFRFEKPNWVLHWSVLRDHPGKPGHGTEFVSADGRTLRVWRGGWVLLDPDGKEMPKEESEPVGDHWRDWIDCMKTRATPRADLQSVAQTTIMCHLVNASLMSGQTVRWDKSRMDIIGKTGKDTLAYHREYRKPWGHSLLG